MSARFLAVSAVAALTLTACGGGGETAQDAAPPVDLGAFRRILRNDESRGSVRFLRHDFGVQAVGREARASIGLAATADARHQHPRAV